MLISSMCLSSPLKAKQEAKSEHVKDINIMTQTMEAREAHVENMRSAFMKLQKEYQRLYSDYEAAIAAVNDVEAKLEAVLEEDEETFEPVPLLGSHNRARPQNKWCLRCPRP
jgi:hypothetical protein